MKLLHLKIFVGVWIFIILIGLIVPRDLLTENLYSTHVMSVKTIVWISICFFAFWMGTFIERSLYAGNLHFDKSDDSMPVISEIKVKKILKTFKLILFLVTGILLIRFIWGILKIGTLIDFLLTIITNPIYFRFEVSQKTTIHGMGALSDIIIACTIFSFGLFALMKKYSSNISKVITFGYNDKSIKMYYRKSIKFLIVSLMILTFYFIFASERLVLVMALLGGLLTYYMVLQRFPIKNFIYIALFFFFIWIFVEGYLRREFSGSETIKFVWEYAINRLILYLVPAIRNVDVVINYIPNHTYGWYTFNFIPTILKLDFLSSISENIYNFTPYHVVPGFGAIPIFGAVYADYGFASLFYFILIGFVYQFLYRKAIIEKRFLAIQLYSFSIVALIISFMPFLPTLGRFWVNIVALVVINKSLNLGFKE